MYSNILDDSTLRPSEVSEDSDGVVSVAVSCDTHARLCTYLFCVRVFLCICVSVCMRVFKMCV